MAAKESENLHYAHFLAPPTPTALSSLTPFLIPSSPRDRSPREVSPILAISTRFYRRHHTTGGYKLP